MRVPAAQIDRRIAQTQIEADRLRHRPQLAREGGRRPCDGQGCGVALLRDQLHRSIRAQAGNFNAGLARPQAGHRFGDAFGACGHAGAIGLPLRGARSEREIAGAGHRQRLGGAAHVVGLAACDGQQRHGTGGAAGRVGLPGPGHPAGAEIEIAGHALIQVSLGVEVAARHHGRHAAGLDDSEFAENPQVAQADCGRVQAEACGHTAGERQRQRGEIPGRCDAQGGTRFFVETAVVAVDGRDQIQAVDTAAQKHHDHGVEWVLCRIRILRKQHGRSDRADRRRSAAALEEFTPIEMDIVHRQILSGS